MLLPFITSHFLGSTTRRMLIHPGFIDIFFVKNIVIPPSLVVSQQREVMTYQPRCADFAMVPVVRWPLQVFVDETNLSQKNHKKYRKFKI